MRLALIFLRRKALQAAVDGDRMCGGIHQLDNDIAVLVYVGGFVQGFRRLIRVVWISSNWQQ